MIQGENSGPNRPEAPDGFEEILELTQEEKRELLEMWKDWIAKKSSVF